MSIVHDTIPGMEKTDASAAISQLENRLVATIDLQLVLKHIHWNVVGREFLTVHEMLDEQVEAVREMTDEIAERIATLGGAPNGNSGAVVAKRTWDDYGLGRTNIDSHLLALDKVYDGVISDHRQAIEVLESHDLVTQDMLVAQSAKLELFQWFIRSFRGTTVDGAPITSPLS